MRPGSGIGGRFPFQTAWDEYKEKKAEGCAVSLVFVPAFVAIVFISREFPKIGAWSFPGLFVLILVLAVYRLFRPAKMFTCPACGGQYHQLKQSFGRRKCVNCGLPLFYGSTHFTDYWGREKASALAKKYEERLGQKS